MKKKDYDYLNKLRPFGLHKGSKMDAKSYSWLFIEGVVYLSYSYMTFVINNQMGNEEGADFVKADYLFDDEQYNYTRLGFSSLTDEILIKNSRKLKWVLDGLYSVNPKSIELLQFYHYFGE